MAVGTLPYGRLTHAGTEVAARWQRFCYWASWWWWWWWAAEGLYGTGSAAAGGMRLVEV